MAAVTITEYTDPGCPFAFSAEPFRRRLQWLFGDQLEWRPRMVVLADTPEEYLEKGFTTERQSSSFETLSREHGMPIDTRLRPRMAATAPACRAVVAARLFAPEAERALLRRLRVRHFSGQLLDDPATIADAAVDAGIDPAELTQWLDRPEVDDGAASRTRPPPARRRAAALAQSHKLAEWSGGMRYTCPSYEIEGLSVPGLPAVGGLRGGAGQRRARARASATRRATSTEVLRWAGTPLATREVAEVCQISDREAREALGRVAVEAHVGADGFWSLTD